jgi:hypothetical protein
LTDSEAPLSLCEQVLVIPCLLLNSTAHHSLPKEVKRIQSFRESYTPEYMRRCENWESVGSGKVLPRQWKVDPAFQWGLSMGKTEERRTAAEAAARRAALEADVEADYGLQALRLFSLNSDVAQALVSARENDEIELPFELAPDQQTFAACSGSKMAIGRSGTGKTTAIFTML